MVVTADDVLEFVKKTGPLLSIKVAKHFKINTIYAGAYLSELISKKKIQFSYMKIGTSPLYYTDSQKPKLEEFSERLNPREKKTFDLLKQKKIIREKEVDNITKATLRNIKDFAVSLVVNFNNQKEIFWKYFLLDNIEAQKIIKQMLTIKKPKSEAKPILKKEKVPIKEVHAEFEEKIQSKKVIEKTKPKPVTEKEPKKISDNLLEKQKEIKAKERKLLKEKEQLEKELHKTIEQEQKALEKQRKEFLEQQKEMQKQRQELMGMMAEIRKERSQLEMLKSGKESVKATTQRTIVPVSERVEKEKDEFFVKVREYLKSHEMKIKEYDIIKKGEVDLVISIPAAIGSVDYYCCAKKKKRSNEGDLSTAYIKGQNKKLPVIYLSLGKVTKKAAEMLKKEFKGLVVKKIE